MTIARAGLVFVAAAFVSTHVACGQSIDVTPVPANTPRSPMMSGLLRNAMAGEEPRIKERVGRIKEELAALDRAALKDGDWAKEWAGVYSEGDGLGTNITIHLSPKGGIAFLNYGCMGLYGADHGDVVEALPDGLRLKLVFGDVKRSFLSDRIYFVKWGDERFLVPDWMMIEFVNNYNEGGYSRRSMFGVPRLSRDGQPHRSRFATEQAPAGRPELPETYAKMLLDKPLKLKVTKVATPSSRDRARGVTSNSCDLTFEGGADQGVYVGMEFKCPRGLSFSGHIRCHVRITKVDKTSCSGEFVSYDPLDQVKPPEVGDIVVTGDESPAAIEPAAPKGEVPKASPAQDGRK